MKHWRHWPRLYATYFVSSNPRQSSSFGFQAGRDEKRLPLPKPKLTLSYFYAKSTWPPRRFLQSCPTRAEKHDNVDNLVPCQVSGSRLPVPSPPCSGSWQLSGMSLPLHLYFEGTIKTFTKYAQGTVGGYLSRRACPHPIYNNAPRAPLRNTFITSSNRALEVFNAIDYFRPIIRNSEYNHRLLSVLKKHLTLWEYEAQ